MKVRSAGKSDFASLRRRARLEPPRVNGIRIARDRNLTGGDVVRVGDTEFRFEEPQR